jgi:hypothetical protein
MPVNVDTVYQTVQALVNKEQRGYLTPQEFNLFANQAQQDIFEQYFYDLNAFRGARPQERQIADSVSFLQHKIRNTEGVDVNNARACSYDIGLNNGTWDIPSGNLTGRIFHEEGGHRRELRVLPGHVEELLILAKSKWHLERSGEIFYFEDGWNRIQVHKVDNPVKTGITCEEVSGKPGLVYWNYVVINEKAVYAPKSSQDFGLHVSEQPDLVAKILKLAGISIESQELYQAGAAEEGLNLQQENK